MSKMILGKRILGALLAIVVLSVIITVSPVSMRIGVPAKAAPNLNIGDYLTMGTYYGEPILWRCVDKDTNGTLMLADKILTFKSFDASGNHVYSDGQTAQNDVYNPKDFPRSIYGSNLWETSTLRAWLNSSTEDGSVEWLGGVAPDSSSVWNGYNTYDVEAGFLSTNNFSASEKNLILNVNQKQLISTVDTSELLTDGTEEHYFYSRLDKFLGNYDSAYSYSLNDKMFLLDLKQLSRVIQNDSILKGKYYFAKPNPAAVENSNYQSEAYGKPSVYENWHYWLRDPAGKQTDYRAGLLVPSFVREVMDDKIRDKTVGQIHAYESGVGVRPAFYLDSENSAFPSGSGGVSDPYVVVNTNDAPLETPPVDNTNTMPPYSGSGGGVTNPPIVAAPGSPGSQSSNDSTMWIIIGISAIILILAAAGVLTFILFNKDKPKSGAGPSWPVAPPPSGAPYGAGPSWPVAPPSGAPYGAVPPRPVAPPPSGAPYGAVPPRPVAPSPPSQSIWNDSSQPPDAYNASTQRCTSCGESMIPGSKFCTKCGSSF